MENNTIIASKEARFMWLKTGQECIDQRHLVEKLRRDYLRAKKKGLLTRAERKLMLARIKAERNTWEFLCEYTKFFKDHAALSDYTYEYLRKKHEEDVQKQLKEAEEAKRKAEEDMKKQYEQFMLQEHINRWQKEKHYSIVTVGTKEFELDDDQMEQLHRVEMYHTLKPIRELIRDLEDEIEHLKGAIRADEVEKAYYAKKAAFDRHIEESRTVEEQKAVADAAQICKIQDYLKETGACTLPCEKCGYISNEICRECAACCKDIIEANMEKAHPNATEYFDDQMAYDRIRKIYNKKTKSYEEPVGTRWFLQGRTEKEQEDFLWYCVGQVYCIKQTFPGLTWEECIARTKSGLVKAKARMLEDIHANYGDRDEIISKVFNEQIYLEENRHTTRLTEISALEAEDIPGDKVIKRVNSNGVARYYTYKDAFMYDYVDLEKDRASFFDADDVDEEFDVIENIMDKTAHKVTTHIEVIEELVRKYKEYNKPFAEMYMSLKGMENAPYSKASAYNFLKAFWTDAFKAIGITNRYIAYVKEFASMRAVPAMRMYSTLDLIAKATVDRGFTVSDYLLGDM